MSGSNGKETAHHRSREGTRAGSAPALLRTAIVAGLIFGQLGVHAASWPGHVLDPEKSMVGVFRIMLSCLSVIPDQIALPMALAMTWPRVFADYDRSFDLARSSSPRR